MKDWETLTADEQHFIKNVLAYFAARLYTTKINLIVHCSLESDAEYSDFFILQRRNCHGESWNEIPYRSAVA